VNTQSGEAPLLFDLKFAQLWTDLYFQYYGQRNGWMAGFVLFAFNVQFGAGRNSITLTLFNFNVLASWNARRATVPNPAQSQMQAKGPKLEIRCNCGNVATAVTPICETCAMKLLAPAN